MAKRTYSLGEKFDVSAYVNYSCGEDVQFRVSEGLEIVDKKFNLERCEGARGILVYTVLIKTPGSHSVWKDFTSTWKPPRIEEIKIDVLNPGNIEHGINITI